ILFDTNKRITIAQKPIVISNQFGEYFFEINLPIKGFTNGKYNVELKLKDKTLKSKSFLVQN
ncbi:MAG: hypothetical protein OEW99_07615, partial [Gammaproteobacteria bacterium]|nr:hypothetical protein [Gammaproteobacteria bacterium]